jgi:quinol monooxygenase YgiN
VITTAALIRSSQAANRRADSESYFGPLGNRGRVGFRGGWYYINAVDIEVVPGQFEVYLAAIKEVGAATMKTEPGCSEFDITVSQKDPNHLFIFEVYDNAATFDAHLKSDHYKKYAATAKDIVAKREVHPLSSVAMMKK